MQGLRKLTKEKTTPAVPTASAREVRSSMHECADLLRLKDSALALGFVFHRMHVYVYECTQKRQQEYSIDYEAYRHFAFFAGLLLQANAPTPTSAVDLVKWYLTEKAYCVPRDLSRPLVPNVYTTLVHNLILDSCVDVVEGSEDGHLQLLPNKYFLLWAWKDFALDFDVRMRATPF
ncbi:uncharacterized protein EMH_0082560 [Eimeria mitis]|uniref:Uncharacterized protein n=1 Tax=Eimeria mitis TaxID=44415 RepID=U6K9F7_9EIME|nr:uncharacterized protein EMH_0082560 [Eimeria mitis]CDJ33441.1 hypothetical protein EMH_0082560 [Eimeria mitis]